jgi:hypothetical protein
MLIIMTEDEIKEFQKLETPVLYNGNKKLNICSSCPNNGKGPCSCLLPKFYNSQELYFPI